MSVFVTFLFFEVVRVLQHPEFSFNLHLLLIEDVLRTRRETLLMFCSFVSLYTSFQAGVSSGFTFRSRMWKWASVMEMSQHTRAHVCARTITSNHEHTVKPKSLITAEPLLLSEALIDHTRLIYRSPFRAETEWRVFSRRSCSHSPTPVPRRRSRSGPARRRLTCAL